MKPFYPFLLFVGLLLLAACGAAATPERRDEAVSPPSTPWSSPTAAVAVAPTRPLTETAAPTVPPPTATRRPATATTRPSATSLPSTSTPIPPSETPLPPTATSLPPTATLVPPTAVPPSATSAPQVTGVACQRPPNDNRSTVVRNHTISMRTLAMLDNAQALYGGPGSTRWLIQGSYDRSTGASFGTHDGGGAVDIWTVYPGDTTRLIPDIDGMVLALRQAGFAAWFRPKDMLYVGMYPHIHAIAIGDPDLSAAARAQIEGPHGYLAGRNGLPDAPHAGADPHGGPILCDWMADYGYRAAAPAPTAAPSAICRAPTDDYGRVTVGEGVLSRRTQGMLQTAQALYGGPGTLLQVTQGSYNSGTAGSFGTHDGGGAVDLSIRHPQTRELLFGETGRMVTALRQAGFAAWFRSEAEGYAPHIHAIAIGDAELSPAATEQLTGAQGYFRGRNALPDERGAPDPHGGPIVCDWMHALGYRDLR